MKRIIHLIAFVIFIKWSIAQTVNLGADSIINTITSGIQSNTAIAVDSSSGTYFVVWESLSSSGEYNIYGRTVDRLGSALGSDFLIGNLSNGRFPDIAQSSTGSVAIVWSNFGQDGDGHGIFGRLASANGTLGTSFSVNSTTAENQKHPSVGVSSNGNFVVVWASENQDGSHFGIYGQRFNSSGVKVGSEFLVNNVTVGYQSYPDIAVAANGSFIVAWQSNGTDGSGNGVYARRFTSSGTALASQFLVNTTTAGNQQEPTVSIKKNGDFGIAWSSYGQDGDEYGVYAKFYDSSASIVKSEFKVNTLTDGNQGHVDMTTSPSGRYLLTYTNDTTSASVEGIYLAAYDSTGTESFTPKRVNVRTSDKQQFSAIASYEDDSMMVVYQDGLRESTTTVDGDDFAIVGHLASFSNVPLPVALLNFTAKAVNHNSAILNWATATEINNSHFLIQRSFDGISFENLTHIEGYGNTNTENNYSYLDEEIPNQPDLAYYRLKQVDFDGVHEYSDIRRVEFGLTEQKTSQVKFYPNPAENTLNIQFTESTKGNVKLIFFDNVGKKLFEQHLKNRQSTIDISFFHPGTYYLKFDYDQYVTEMKKLVIY